MADRNGAEMFSNSLKKIRPQPLQSFQSALDVSVDSQFSYEKDRNHNELHSWVREKGSAHLLFVPEFEYPTKYEDSRNLGPLGSNCTSFKFTKSLLIRLFIDRRQQMLQQLRSKNIKQLLLGNCSLGKGLIALCYN